MKNELFILISTINRRILNLTHVLQPYNKKIRYVVSHQLTEAADREVALFVGELVKRKDVEYSVLQGKGVAENRNNALKFVRRSSISLILDDDIRLRESALTDVLNAFQNNPGADVITFKILGFEGNDFKKYPVCSQWHTLFTLTGIGTTEIAFRNDFVLDKKVVFDERFGPGSETYPIGEDFIFATDLYAKGAHMLFIPIPIVIHPAGSTGSKTDIKIVLGRGAMFARVFGWKAFAINLLFSINKYATYRKKITFFSYLFFLTKGTIDYFIPATKRASSKSCTSRDHL